MGQGVITSDEIVQRNLLQPTIDQYTKLIVEIEKANVELNKNAKAFSDVATAANEKSKKSLNDLAAAYAKAQKVVDQSIKNDKDKIEVTARLNKAQVDAIRLEKAQEQLAQAKLRTAAQQAAAAKREAADKEKANKLTRDENILNDKNAGTLEKLAARNRVLTKERRSLNLETAAGAKRLIQINYEIDRNNALIERNSDKLTKQRIGIGRYEKALSGLRTGLSQLGVSFGIGFAARKGIEIMAEFEESAANMAKTLNVSVDAAKDFSLELTQLNTGTSIEDLQEIATIGGQMGISAKEIVGFTESLDKLNVALGDEFEGGAEEITKTIGGLRNVLIDFKTGDVSDDILKIGNALNVLGAEGIATAPIVSDFATRIGGVGIPLGLSTDQVLGMSAALQELNINSERGGTAVSRILQKMTVDTAGFASVAGMGISEFENMLNTDLYGAFQLVLKGLGKFKGDSVGLSQELANLRLNGAGVSEVVLKLSGNMDLMNEKVDLTGDSLKNTNSITEEFNTKNSTLSATVGYATNKFKAWLIEVDKSSGATLTLKNIIKFLADNMNGILTVLGKAIKAFVIFKSVIIGMKMAERYNEWKEYNKAVKEGSKNLQDASKSATDFGRNLKAVGWTAIIALATELASAIYDIGTGADVAAQKLEALDNMRAIMERRNKAIIKTFDDEIERERKRLEIAVARGKMDQNQANKEFKNFLLRKEYQRSEVDYATRTEKDIYENKFDRLRREQDLITRTIELKRAEIRSLKKDGEFSNRLKIGAIQGEIQALAEAKIGIGQYIKSLNDELFSTEVSIEADKVQSAGIEKKTKKIKEEKEAVKELDESYKDLEESIRSLESAQVGVQIDDVSTNIEDELQKQTDQAIKTGQFEKDLFVDLIKDKYDLRVRDSEDIRDFEKMQAERDIKDAQKLAVELERIEFEHQQRLKQASIDGRNERNDGIKQLEEAQMQFYEQTNKDEVDAETKKNEELYNAYKNFQEALTEVLKDQIDARIEALKKEEDAAKSRQDYFEQLAANGNITAKESITEQIELQRAAQEEQARLEATKQRVEAISAGLKTYIALIEDGKTPTQALTGALTTTEVLASLLRNIPFFEKGTENAPKGWAVVDEKGAELITDKKGNIKEIGHSKGARMTYLDAGDKVITASKTANLLNRFDQIEMSRIVNAKKDTVGNSFDLLPLQNELKGMRSDMNKLQTTYETNWEGLASVLPHFVVTRTKGGDKRTDRYTVG